MIRPPIPDRRVTILGFETMPHLDRRSLWELISASGLPDQRFVADADGRVALRDLEDGTSLRGDIETFRGRSVLISSERQLPAVLAAAELDGIARRIVLCPPDVPSEHIAVAIADAEVDSIVSDGTGPASDAQYGEPSRSLGGAIRKTGTRHARDTETEWLLFTSGTTGRPKLVIHSLASLTGPLDDGLAVARDAVWCTFYDVRRYGGLQMLMRAFLGGASMVLSHAREPVGDFLGRIGAAGVTHVSGTPSHWRRALMSASITSMSPRYVRLSGEVADQAILDNLRIAFPDASVAFDVRDGLAGFPASLIGQPDGKVQMRVTDGSLRIRSTRTATRYAGNAVIGLADDDGFVDTGDMVELRDGRYHFVGRREGIINVGGLKVHPEEIEAVINQHPAVQMSRVRGRPNPITGAIVVADIVIRSSAGLDAAPLQAVKDEICDACRRALPPYKVPVMVRSVTSLEITASGKLARPHA
jgi:acyl-CoA synthetase (AMP-forming)/AMP-acid ligase II